MEVKNDFSWWGYLDLNQGPIGYEPTALTTELYPHTGEIVLLSQNYNNFMM